MDPARPATTPPRAAHGPEPILTSMRPDGSRLMIHPADVHGRWIRWRRVVFAALALFYVGAPLVKVGGYPSVFLDVEHRRFSLFGTSFNAQDFWLAMLIGLSVAFALLFVTAWRGRVWCGWACPQTVFLEGVYRPIERLFDGPRERRLRAQQEPWTAKRVARFVAKQAVFLGVSVAISHAATAIFVSPGELASMIVEGPAAHPEAFLLSTGFAVILMFNFAWFREQFCVVLCPYGRLQSVLHDRDSIVVAYDERRGEPRGHLKKGAGPGERPGDCVDCHKCVHVCPTGIDIRNGLQMECLGCQQCIDACDGVMDKLKKPRGLIGFMSTNQVLGAPTRVLRPRLVIYGALTLLCLGTLGVSVAVRTPFEANIIRPRGENPFTVDGRVVRNHFEVHLVNKNPAAATFRLSLTAPVPMQAIIAPHVALESLQGVRLPVAASIDAAHLATPVTLTLRIEDATNGRVKEQPVRFLAPPASPPRAPRGE